MSAIHVPSRHATRSVAEGSLSASVESVHDNSAAASAALPSHATEARTTAAPSAGGAAYHPGMSWNPKNPPFTGRWNGWTQ